MDAQQRGRPAPVPSPHLVLGPERPVRGDSTGAQGAVEAAVVPFISNPRASDIRRSAGFGYGAEANASYTARAQQAPPLEAPTSLIGTWLALQSSQPRLPLTSSLPTAISNLREAPLRLGGPSQRDGGQIVAFEAPVATLYPAQLAAAAGMLAESEMGDAIQTSRVLQIHAQSAGFSHFSCPGLPSAEAQSPDVPVGGSVGQVTSQAPSLSHRVFRLSTH